MRRQILVHGRFRPIIGRAARQAKLDERVSPSN